MLKVLVGLEEGLSGVELYQDAADAPKVAGVGPAQAEDDFGSAVVTGRDDSGMVLLLKGCAAKVYELDCV